MLGNLFVRENLERKEEEKMKIVKPMLTFVFALVVSLVMVGNATAFFIDFEDGVNGAPVTDIPGISFLDYNGYASLYLDCSTGSYNCSDMNGSYSYGGYYIYDNVGLWAGPNADAQGVIVDFTSNDGTWFSTGYSANSNFYVVAYLTDGSTVTASGGKNYGVGMDFLSVAASAGTYIDYVVLHDTGNYWVVDNMSGDASGVNVPEPGTLLLIGSGLIGLAFARRKMI
ncbi:MAG: PEP-CTERM sorting domain-containing protein [Nitrospirota bacterium]|nr:PEP-CTERM sorting domain-containing protein [Nitrospirota bacterium]